MIQFSYLQAFNLTIGRKISHRGYRILPDIEKIKGELRIMGFTSNDYSFYFTNVDNQVKEIEIRFERPQKHLPSQIFKITGLNILRLSNIISIPDEIANLKQLRLLEIVKHHDRKLNPKIVDLEKLELLIIRRSKIDSLPPAIIRLRKLRDLDLINTSIPVVPPFLNKLPNLKYLSLAGFEDTAEELSAKLSEFKGLSKLFIGKFKQAIFPSIWEGLSSLTDLTHLTISGYNNNDPQLEFVSPLINNLQQLETLWVDGPVTCFPDIPDLENLQELYLTFTPLNSSAKSILESKNGVCINPNCVLHKAEGDHRKHT